MSFPWRSRPELFLSLLFIGTLCYAPTLFFSFVHDDLTQIVGNPIVQEWRYLPAYFTQHVWAHVYGYSQANYYRPLFMLWLLLNERLFGMNPMGWHLTTLLAHLAATSLIVPVAAKLLKDWRPAAVAALVFMLHPAQVESVAWVSGVSEPLLAIFLLGSFLAYLQYQPAGSRSWLALALVLFFFALLCKETAVALPVAIFCHRAMLGSGPPLPVRQRLQRSLRTTLPYLVLLLPYTVLRVTALHSPLQASFKVSLATALLTTPSLVWLYLRHLLVPVHLALNYYTPYVTALDLRNFILPLFAVLTACVAVYLLARRSPLAGFAGLWILTFLALPVASANLFVYFDLVHDRYLYLPMVGFALLVAMAWQQLARFLPESRLGWQTAVLVVLLIWYTGATLLQQRYWKDNLALYGRSLKVSSQHFLPRILLASALEQGNQADKQQALQLLREAESMSDGHWLAEMALGDWYYQARQFDESEKYYLRVITLNPSNPLAYCMLGETRLRRADGQGALAPLQRAVFMVPGNVNYRLRYATALESTGDLQQAVEQYQAVLRLQPNEPILRDRMARLERRITQMHSH